MSFLVLEDGTVFRGRSVGAPGIAFGEAVFATSMTGYQEVVTDPSYAEQLVCFTAPMIGNYGVADHRSESADAHARAVLMRRSGGEDWLGWLATRGVVALEEIDTRSLVLHLRDHGSMRGAAVSGDASVEHVLGRVRAEAPMAGRSLVDAVSTRRTRTSGRGRTHVAILDYGCKSSIAARVRAAGARVTMLPHDATADVVLALRADGILLSNGPGDPAALAAETSVVERLLGRVPVLGICLGHQLLALAAGFRTFKLPFGHRGANHPVLERASGRVLVTAQNHGFAVAASGPEVTHVSLYDATVEGLSLPHLRARSVQFHPEASPGPHDARSIVEDWVAQLEEGLAAAA